MAFCGNCGYQVAEGDDFCPNCGEPIKKIERRNTYEGRNTNEGRFDTTRENVGRAASEFSDVARATASRAGDEVKRRKEQIDQYFENRVNEKVKKYEKKKVVYSDDEIAQATSKTELWSSLKKDAERKQFYTDEDNTVTEDEFANMVAEKIGDNHIPARIVKRHIRWEHSSVFSDIYVIDPITSLPNPYTYILQFNHVGKHSFVENKKFITPPNLPKEPGTYLPLGPHDLRNAIIAILLGVFCVFAGIQLGSAMRGYGGGGSSSSIALIVIFGLLCIAFGVFGIYNYSSIKDHNDKVRQEVIAWNRAWARWNDNIYSNAFEEDINGALSRIYDATLLSVEQVSKELFPNQMVSEESEEVKLSELNAIVNERRKSYR